MLETLQQNLIFIGYGVLIYILTLITNIITSIAVSKEVKNLPFNKQILINGLVKYGMTVLGTLLLTIIITLLIQYTTYYKILGENLNDINIAIIATTYTLTSINYIKKIYNDITELIK